MGGDLQRQARQQAIDAFAGIPLSGAMEQGRRSLEDQLASSLAQLGYSWDQIAPMMNVLMSRLQTEQAQARQALREDYAGRGVFQGGVAPAAEFETDTQFSRERQNAAMDAQEQYTQVANQAQEAYQAYTQGLYELLLQLAAMQAQNPSPTAPSGGGGGGGQNG